MPVTVRVGHGTDAGRVRPLNEDHHHVWRFPRGDGELLVLAVADGMGGAAAGEVASKLAIEALDDTVRRYEREREAGRDVVGLASLLTKAVRLANGRVHRAALRQKGTRGMGTTLTCVATEHDVAHVAHVGDSRAYLIRDDRIHPLTRDHSWVEEQVEKGILSEEEARDHAWRNLITRALGTRPQVVSDAARVDLAAHDLVLLATDGLHGVVDDSEILAAVRRGGDPQAMVDDLVALALQRGGPDNVTVVIAEVP